jgi:hypothetical protein
MRTCCKRQQVFVPNYCVLNEGEKASNRCKFSTVLGFDEFETL